MKRQLFIASSLASLGLAGCGPVKESLTNGPFRNVLLSTEHLNNAVIGTRGLAREYKDADVDRNFRVNGLDTPSDATYASLAAGGFRDYRLVVDGLVEHPQKLSLAELRAAGDKTQITRHDCVEGWSAIGKWQGPMLGNVLKAAGVRSTARYIVFTCADLYSNAPYYESIDMVDAFHPQTILAWAMNDQRLSVGHGAPVRLRVERQLGYKNAKYVIKADAVASLDGIGGGQGGYWEDAVGYDWYAGI